MSAITFRTVVLDVPPSPLGMSPRRIVIQHWCNECRQKVDNDSLSAHTRAHGDRLAVEQEGGPID